MLRVILPQLSALSLNIKDQNLLSYNYVDFIAKNKYNDIELKIKGFLRINKNNLDIIEGAGQIRTKSKQTNIIYVGKWENGEILVDSLISDIVHIANNEIIFEGFIYPFISERDIITHTHIRLNLFRINIPVVDGADLTLELIDGTTFEIILNNSKSIENFSIYDKLSVNELISKSIAVDRDTDEIYELTISIKKDKVIFTRTNLDKNNNKASNFKYIHELKCEPVYFLEKQMLRLPKDIKNIVEILTNLSEVCIRIEN
jgi:hypothetical protein